MAEALGLVASLAGIVQLSSEITKMTYHYVNGVRRANESKRQYYQEVSTFTDLLVQTLAALKASEARAKGSIQVPASLNVTVLTECRRSLMSIKSELQQPSRRWKWPFREGELKKSIESLHRFRGMFSDYVSASTLLEVDKMVRELDRARILDWIGDAGGASQAQRIQPHEGTGAWFVASKPFQNWLHGKPSMLWCHGDPGVGKSVLTTTAEQSLAGNLVASYRCHFSAQRDMQKVGIILKQYLRQIVQKLDMEGVSKLVEICPDPEKLQTVKGIAEVLTKACSLPNGGVFIILDGPDELKEPLELLDRLKRLASASGAAKVLVTSRNVPVIAKSLGGVSEEFELVAHGSDLEGFVRHRMQTCDVWDDADDTALEDFTQAVVNKVGGTFLLAKLLTDHLLQSTTIGEMHNCLESAPSELRQEYEATMLRIDSQSGPQKALARRAIAWITHSERPLTVTELTHALAVKTNTKVPSNEDLVRPEKLLQVCQGLVTISHGAKIISMIHASAYEFFRMHFGQGDICHLDIASTCLTYLSGPPLRTGPCSTWDEMKERLELLPFMAYSSQFWGCHIVNVDIEEKLQREMMNLAEDESLRSCSFQGLLLHREPMEEDLASMIFLSIPSGHTALHVAAYWNLQYTASRLLERGTLVSQSDSASWTPLHWACYRGWQPMVRLLLQNKADPNAIDNTGWTPLFWASIFGDVDSVDDLLNGGANPRVKSKSGWTALHWATCRRQLRVVKILLGHQANFVRLRERDRRRFSLKEALLKDLRVEDFVVKDDLAGVKLPLDIAVEAGDQDLFDAIARNAGADDDSRTDTLIGLWEQKGFDRAPQAGADPWRVYMKPGFHHFYEAHWHQSFKMYPRDEASARWRSELLMGAIRDSRLDAVKILLHRGADPNYDSGPDNKPRYPLHAAAYRRDPEFAKVLLAHGADPNRFDESLHHGVTALHLAIANGFEKTTVELISGGADVNAHGSAFVESSLQYDSVFLLIRKEGRYPRARRTTLDFVSPLAIAVTVEDIAWYLSGKGAAPSAAKGSGAASRLVKILLSNGADPNNVCGSSSDQLTALHFAACVGNYDVIGTLVAHGADILSIDEIGRSVMHCLAHKLPDLASNSVGLCSTVTLILEKAKENASTNTLFGTMDRDQIDNINDTMADRPGYPQENDEVGRACVTISERDNPVTIAAKLGNWEVFHAFLDHGAPVPQGSDLQSLLWLATTQLQEEAVASLVQLGTRITNFPKQIVPSLVEATLSRIKELEDPVGVPKVFAVLLRDLVRADADINGRDSILVNTPLLELISQTDAADLVDELLRHGADPFISNPRGLDSFLMAIVYEREHTVRCLIRFARGNPREQHWSRLLKQTTTEEPKDLDQICACLKRSGQLGVTNEYGETLIHFAAESGNSYVLGLLLNHGSDPFKTNNEGFNPLQIAAFAGSVNSLKVIIPALEQSKDPKSRGKIATLLSQSRNEVTPLDLAIERNNADMVGYLLEIGVPLEGDESTPGLCRAVASGSIETVEAMLSHGANPNIADALGWRPLHFACRNGRVDIAAQLLQAGADPNARTLQWERGYEYLNHATAAETAPLHIATTSVNIAMVKLLLTHDADINAKAVRGEPEISINDFPPRSTALQIAFDNAISRKDEKFSKEVAFTLLQLLIDHGADLTDVFMVGSAGAIPADDLLCFEGRDKLWDILKRAAGDVYTWLPAN